MILVDVLGAGVWGPGLPGWTDSRAVLAGERAYVAAEAPAPAPPLLSPTERRRTGPLIRLALAAAADAVAQAGLAPASVRAVFASSCGDGPMVGGILEALTTPGGAVSPTAFHNSVHNAAAGYWSIAGGAAGSATALGAHDSTWAAGLLAAALEAAAGDAPVVLCAYDYPLPPPLAARRPVAAPFAAALLLTATDSRPGAWARLGVRHAALATAPADAEPVQPALRPLARGNAAGQALRLLEDLAAGQADTFPLPYLDGRLEVWTTPCP